MLAFIEDGSRFGFSRKVESVEHRSARFHSFVASHHRGGTAVAAAADAVDQLLRLAVGGARNGEGCHGGRKSEARGGSEGRRRTTKSIRNRVTGST